jgi:hypothetical protein
MEQEFKVGDIVRVKTWKEMVREFPDKLERGRECISVPFAYTSAIGETEGGKIATILYAEEIQERGETVTEYILEIDGLESEYSFSEEMFVRYYSDWDSIQTKLKSTKEFNDELI